MAVSIRRLARRLQASLAGALALSSTVACQRSPGGGAPAITNVEARAETPEQGRVALAERLCARRAGCAVRKAQALSGEGQLLELAIPRASSKEECDGAEYWLARGGKQTLLATDCDAQDGADARACTCLPSTELGAWRFRWSARTASTSTARACPLTPRRPSCRRSAFGSRAPRPASFVPDGSRPGLLHCLNRSCA